MRALFPSGMLLVGCRFTRTACKCVDVSFAGAVLVLLGAMGVPIWCQSPDASNTIVISPVSTGDSESSTTEDIDAMFESPPSDEGEESVPSDDVLSRVVDQKTASVTGTFTATAGYTGGWMQFYGKEAGENGLVSAPVYSMSTLLRLDARLDRTFRVLGSLQIKYPELEARVAELFCDYVLLDWVFLRGGRQIITWGASRTFPFTNLPARLPDGFVADGNADGIDDKDSIALKITVPFGVSGVTGLVLARNGYFDDPGHPGFRELGYGGLLDLSFAAGEIVLGTFYQQDLRPRAFISAKTSLWSVDVFAEALASFNPTDWGSPNLSESLEFAAGGGFIWEGFESRVVVTGEYLYNGERSELNAEDTDLSLPQGHTIMLGLGVKNFPFRKTKTGLQWKHNFSDRSGTVIPGLTVDAFPHLSLSLAIPLVYGPDEGYFIVENPDVRDRRLTVALLATLKGSF